MTHTAAPPTQPPEPDGLRQVSKFEFHLLRILRFLVGHFPADQGFPLVRQGMARPECLSSSAVELVKDTLAKASVLFLTRAGGWQNDHYLRNNTPQGGRVWQRIPLAERVLEFSHAVLDFLLWLTAEKVHETKQAWDAAPQTLTPADELFFALAFDATRTDPEILSVLRRKDAFTRNPLCWLFNPGDVADPNAVQLQLPDFTPLFTQQRAILLECLQTNLTHRWTASERAKGKISDWRKMRQQGQAEFATLRAYLQGAEAAQRFDLARFVLRTNAAILASDPTPNFWTGGLQGSGPPRLADRLETQRAALAVPRQMEVLEGWTKRARNVGYFDEDYQASQLWKMDWEAANGDQVAARAHTVIQMLEPLRGLTDRQLPPPGINPGDTTATNPR